MCTDILLVPSFLAVSLVSSMCCSKKNKSKTQSGETSYQSAPEIHGSLKPLSPKPDQDHTDTGDLAPENNPPTIQSETPKTSQSQPQKTLASSTLDGLPTDIILGPKESDYPDPVDSYDPEYHTLSSVFTLATEFSPATANQLKSPEIPVGALDTDPLKSANIPQRLPQSSEKNQESPPDTPLALSPEKSTQEENPQKNQSIPPKIPLASPSKQIQWKDKTSTGKEKPNLLTSRGIHQQKSHNIFSRLLFKSRSRLRQPTSSVMPLSPGSPVLQHQLPSASLAGENQVIL